MARYSDVIVLRRAVTRRTPEGAVVWENEDTEVFFNRYRLGLQARLAGGSDGLGRVAEGQVRTVDYDGQGLAVLDGAEYSVESASNDGENTVLTLARRLSNG